MAGPPSGQAALLFALRRWLGARAGEFCLRSLSLTPGPTGIRSGRGEGKSSRSKLDSQVAGAQLIFILRVKSEGALPCTTWRT